MKVRPVAKRGRGGEGERKKKQKKSVEGMTVKYNHLSFVILEQASSEADLNIQRKGEAEASKYDFCLHLGHHWVTVLGIYVLVYSTEYSFMFLVRKQQYRGRKKQRKLHC